MVIRNPKKGHSCPNGLMDDEGGRQRGGCRPRWWCYFDFLRQSKYIMPAVQRRAQRRAQAGPLI